MNVCGLFINTSNLNWWHLILVVDVTSFLSLYSRLYSNGVRGFGIKGSFETFEGWPDISIMNVRYASKWSVGQRWMQQCKWSVNVKMLVCKFILLIWNTGTNVHVYCEYPSLVILKVLEPTMRKVGNIRKHLNVILWPLLQSWKKRC